MATTREFVEKLLESPDGVELAFRHLRAKCPPGNAMRNATVTGIRAWRELDLMILEGTISQADAVVQKNQMSIRILKIADRLDRDGSIESETQRLVEQHQRIAEETKGKDDDDANSKLESAPQPDTPVSVLGIGVRTHSVTESVAMMLQLKRQICAVMVDQAHIGTGFLIADRFVLTNRHVLDELLCRSGTRSCVFDHDGEQQIDSLPRFYLRADRVVPESTPGTLAMSDVRDLDYAVLELDAATGGRGIVRPGDVQLHDKDPVIILHYPQAADSEASEPLQASVGAIRDVNGYMRRIAYTAATALGSSGAPVLSARFELIALHHHQQRTVNSHGIPIDAIVADLKQKGFPYF